MMTRIKRMKALLKSAALVALGVVMAAPAGAQDTTATRTPSVGPAIQKIETASALSKEKLLTVTGIRQLPDGTVLVNDGQSRRLLLMDTTLTTIRVVLDSLTDVANTYGTRPGALIPFPGDTTLFLDPASYAMLVIDPAGRLSRVRSVPRAQDVYMLTSPNQFGYAGADAKGRIIYRVPAQVSPAVMMMAMSSTTPFYPPQPDSAFIVAVDLSTRRLDTLGSIRIPKQEMRMRSTGDNGWTVDQILNPLPRTDDWAVMSDGRVAFVRGLDYRIDYLHPDESWTSSPKLPYEWQRLMDEDKKKFVDSVRALQEKAAATQFVGATIRWVNMYNGKYPENFKVPEGFAPPAGFPKDWFLPTGVKFPANYTYACAPGETPMAGGMPGGMTTQTMVMSGGGMSVTSTTMGAPPAGAPPAASPPGRGAPGAAAPPAGCLPAPIMMNMGGMTPPPPTMRPIVMVEPDQLPDYRPPMTSGAVRADEDGNLWIKFVQPKPIPGGPVYDIVSPQGELVNRIQLPPGYTLIGFGKGKVVYLQMRDATGIHLARVRLK